MAMDLRMEPPNMKKEVKNILREPQGAAWRTGLSPTPAIPRPTGHWTGRPVVKDTGDIANAIKMNATWTWTTTRQLELSNKTSPCTNKMCKIPRVR